MVRAMLVENNNGFRESLKKILSKRYPSIHLTESEDREEAIRKIDLLPPDLIFMDIRLPDGNGLELSHLIKVRYPDVVIVILSNYDLPEYREAAFRSGANYFVPKDSSMGEFLSLVEKIMGSEVTVTRKSLGSYTYR